MKNAIIILGAGAAGLMCALTAGKRGKKVTVIEHSPKPGGKILISGGGRCNFTNLGASPEQFVSDNPDFCRSALSRYTPQQFIDLVIEHKIAFHEKKLGQLFCDVSARDILNMLLTECERAGVTIQSGLTVESVKKDHHFTVVTDQGTFDAASLVVATGGLSIPKMGATDLGYRIAHQFGLRILETAPALDGFTFDASFQKTWDGLAGVSADCIVTCGNISFRENILFTHVGLSGPAALQASLYWRPGMKISLNFVPDQKSDAWLAGWLRQKDSKGRSEIQTLTAQFLPQRLAQRLTDVFFGKPAPPLSRIPNVKIKEWAEFIQKFTFTPSGTVGYTKAEVTRGGVDTRELSSKTMEALKVPGLYFIGEVVDVTGWLGGYNFQWAWASGHAAGGSL